MSTGVKALDPPTVYEPSSTGVELDPPAQQPVVERPAAMADTLHSLLARLEEKSHDAGRPTNVAVGYNAILIL